MTSLVVTWLARVWDQDKWEGKPCVVDVSRSRNTNKVYLVERREGGSTSGLGKVSLVDDILIIMQE